MTPDEEHGFAVYDLIEEIRKRAMLDLIQIIAAVREVGKVLEENDAMELLMPERWRQTLFCRALRDVKLDLWRALVNVQPVKQRCR